MYRPNPNCYGDMFALPSSILDIALESADTDALKAILWIFKHPNEPISLDALSEALCISADAVLAALNFWVSKGILLCSDDCGNVKFIPKMHRNAGVPPHQKTKAEASAQAVQTPAAVPAIAIAKPTMEQIASRMQEDATVGDLFSEAQAVLGRTFGLDMQGTLLTFLDTYGLPKEVILTLLQHLTETGRNSTANIARTGKIWAENEINTLDEANAYIQKDSEAEKLFARLRMAIGISAPKPTPKQSEYLRSWLSLSLPYDMILDAYEEAAERTGKISFAYMDKVLQSWKKEGFTSKADAIKAKQQNSLSKAQANPKSTSFDLDEAVRKATFSAKKQS